MPPRDAAVVTREVPLTDAQELFLADLIDGARHYRTVTHHAENLKQKARVAGLVIYEQPFWRITAQGYFLILRAKHDAERFALLVDPYGELKNASPSIVRRFWSKVNRRGGNDCWPWTGSLSPSGYGQLQTGGRDGRLVLASRVSLIIAGRAAPNDREACHSCDNPPCVNPNHLFPGTHAENMADSKHKGRNYTGGAYEPRCGERSPAAKLKESEVREIKRLLRDGIMEKPIAEQFGVSRSAIGSIAQGKAWRHINGL